MEMVSIIVPVYKAEKKIERCLLSLISQTYKNIEIILVNDGTPDRAFEICKEYAKKDSRIILIDKEKNTGRSDTRNLGIEQASGKYIAFVDSDDFVAENYIERLLEISHYGKYWGMCSYYILGKPLRIEDYQQRNIILSEKIYSREKIADIMKMLIFNPVWNKLYIRNIIINKNIIFDKKLNLGEDLKFNLAYWRYWNGKMCISLEQLYAYDLTEPDQFEYDIFDSFVSMWGEFVKMTSSAKYKLGKQCIDEVYVRIFDELVRAILHDYSLKNGSWLHRYRKARENLNNRFFRVLLSCKKIHLIKRLLIRCKLINSYRLISFMKSKMIRKV